MNRNILVALALATLDIALDLLILGIHVFMLFKPMIADAFSGWT